MNIAKDLSSILASLAIAFANIVAGVLAIAEYRKKKRSRKRRK